MPKASAVSGPRSQSRLAFHDNSGDVRSLGTIHNAAKSNPALKRHLGPANKGTYLLVAALWETYCEDVLVETMTNLLAAARDPSVLPVAVRRAIARELRVDKNELSPWRLAGDGWKSFVDQRTRGLCVERAFNSPKAAKVDELFSRGLGIPDISAGWSSDRVTDPRLALDEHLARRGELAHSAASTSITKKQVSSFYQLTRDITESMDCVLGSFLMETIQHDPYASRAN